MQALPREAALVKSRWEEQYRNPEPPEGTIASPAAGMGQALACWVTFSCSTPRATDYQGCTDLSVMFWGAFE